MLRDSQIVERLVHRDIAKRIVITPMVRMTHQMGSNGIDLRLGTEFIVAERSAHTHFDILDSETVSGARRTRRIRRLDPTVPFVIHPKQFALGSTLEFVRLPRDLAARMDGRSTWARKGLQVHSTASLVHPGAAGVITFELQNMGEIPIMLYPGIRIAQLTFYDLGAAVVRDYHEQSNKYAGHVRAQDSRYQEEPEIEILRNHRAKRGMPSIALVAA